MSHPTGPQRLPRFLTDDACDALIEAARPLLEPAVVYVDGQMAPHPNRQAWDARFERRSRVARAIEDRAAHHLGWPVERFERLHVAHYRQGGRYDAHVDFLPPDAPRQRIATLLMYLNTPAQGGGTTFLGHGMTVPAVRGDAVYFEYATDETRRRSVHQGDEVLRGEKWIATLWVLSAPGPGPERPGSRR